MPDVNKAIKLAYKDQGWHDANPTVVLAPGQLMFLSGSDPKKYKVGNGVAVLSDLKWSTEVVHDFVVLKSPDGHKWKFTVGDDGMLSQPGEDLG